MSLCARGFLRGVVSPFVLLEAERNIQARLAVEAVHSYHNFVTTIPYLVAAVPSPLPAYPAINAKDLHVVATAAFASVAYLLTLDKRLITEINTAQLSFPAITPGDFIKSILPSHIDYPSR